MSEVKKSWAEMWLRAVQVAGVLGVFALYYLHAPVWLPYQYIQLTGDGEVVAERSVTSMLHAWERLHLLTRTDRIARYLKTSPWVEQVSVQKFFDGGLHIQLSYKKPVIRSISGRYSIDHQGQLIDAQVTDDLLRLPVYSGEPQSMKSAFKLWSRLGEWRHRLLSVSVDEFSGWELLFDNKITVRLGVKHLTQRLDLFLKVAQHWHLLESLEEQVFDMRYNNSFSHKKSSAGVTVEHKRDF